MFDLKTYRQLRQLPTFHDLEVFTAARPEHPFRFNPFRFKPLLPMAGAAAGEWLLKPVDVCKYAYFVGEGVEYLLRDAILNVYRYGAQTGIWSAHRPQLAETLIDPFQLPRLPPDSSSPAISLKPIASISSVTG